MIVKGTLLCYYDKMRGVKYEKKNYWWNNYFCIDFIANIFVLVFIGE